MTTIHAVGKRMEIGLSQISKTGGNIIIDCQTDNYAESEMKVLTKLNDLAKFPLNVMIVFNGRVRKILKWEQKTG